MGRGGEEWRLGELGGGDRKEMLLNTFTEGKCGVRTFQCSLTHLPKANVAYAPPSDPKHICKIQMWGIRNTYISDNLSAYSQSLILIICIMISDS